MYSIGLARGARRSSRNFASSRAQKTTRGYAIPELFIDVCQVCEATTTVLRCLQEECSQHLCLHDFDDMRQLQDGIPKYKQAAPLLVGFYCPAHGGSPFPVTPDAALRGCARSQCTTTFHLVSGDVTFFSRVTVPLEVVSKAEAEVVFIDTHTLEMQPEKFQRDVLAALSGVVKVQLVFVLSCWLLPDIQTKAMKDMSHLYSAITFVLFRVARLVPTTDLLNQCVFCWRLDPSISDGTTVSLRASPLYAADEHCHL